MPKTIKMLLLSIIYLISKTNQNFFNNPDFENYTLTHFNTFSCNYMQVYSFFTSNVWYSPDSYGSQFTVQLNTYMVPATKMLLFRFSTALYTICQNLTLIAGKVYTYSFDIGIHYNVGVSTVYVYLNNNLIGIHYKDQTTVTSLTRVSGTFIGQTTNKFCVNSTQIPSNTSPGSKFVCGSPLGTLVDNFDCVQGGTLVTNSTNTTVNNITNTTANQNNNTIANNSISNSSYSLYFFNLNFHTQICDSQNLILLLSTYTVSLTLYQFVQNYSIIYIQGQLQNNYIHTYQNQRIKIIIYIDQPYYITNLTILFNNTFINNGFEYVFDVQLSIKQILTIPLKENQNYILNIAQIIANYTTNIILRGQGTIRHFFFSNVIVNFICQFNIIIFYNFLLLPTQPQFSYTQINKFAKIYFDNSLNLYSLLNNLLNNLNQNIQIKQQQFAGMKQMNQRIPDQINNFQWFKVFGMTYNFIANNFSSLFSFSLLIVKLCILRVTRRLIQIYFHNYDMTYKQMISCLIDQGLCSTPTLTISALISVLYCGYGKFTQKLNYFFHYSLFYFVPLLSFLYLLNSQFQRNKNNPSLQQLKELSKQSQYIKKRQVVSNFYFLYYSFHLIMPCLIVFRHNIIFFIVTSLFILILIIYYCVNFINFSHYKKIHLGLILIITLIHHLCYLLMFIVYYMKIGSQKKQIVLLKFSGIIVIFTLLSGGLIQISDIFINILTITFKIMKRIYKKICGQNNLLQNIQQSKLFNNEESNEKLQKIQQRIQIKQATQKIWKHKKQIFYIPAISVHNSAQIIRHCKYKRSY